MKQITQFPRIPFAVLPTPLYKLEAISREYGKNIYIKRDDMIGVALGGNKVRKLEFLLADAHVVRLLRVCVHGAVDRNACRNAAAVERLCLDRAAVVDGRSAQVDQNGRGSVLRRDADAQRAGRRALIGQNQVLERNIQRAVCRGEVDMVLGDRRE